MGFFRSMFLLFSVLSTISLAIFVRFFLFSGPNSFEGEVPGPGYYGPGQAKPDDPRILPFQVNFSQPQIDGLRRRLSAARIGHKQLEDVPDWSYGIRLGELQEWARYWAEEFDFGQAQAELNKFPQFRTELEGLKIHFLHVKPLRPSAYARVLPLLLAHGWPGGVYEFYQLIPLLTDPKSHSLQSEVAFELVVPSIPGYGFSDQPSKKDLNAVATSRIFHRLMERLGHTHYFAQGGDWGSLIVSNLGRLYPQRVRGVHVNMAMVMPFESVRHFAIALIGCYFPSLVFSEPEHFQHYSMFAMFVELMQESGYMHIQATKPDTVGVALNDSPIGLLAYILEKFSTWTNPAFRSMPDGGLLKKYTRDQVLTLVSIYWFQGNIVSSQRFYKENFKSGLNDPVQTKFVTVPTGYSAFPHDLGGVLPRELMALNYNLTQMRIHRDGGHFAALELPRELAEDVLRFIGAVAK